MNLDQLLFQTNILALQRLVKMFYSKKAICRGRKNTMHKIPPIHRRRPARGRLVLYQMRNVARISVPNQ